MTDQFLWSKTNNWWQTSVLLLKLTSDQLQIMWRSWSQCLKMLTRPSSRPPSVRKTVNLWNSSCSWIVQLDGDFYKFAEILLRPLQVCPRAECSDLDHQVLPRRKSENFMNFFKMFGNKYIGCKCQEYLMRAHFGLPSVVGELNEGKVGLTFGFFSSQFWL